MRNEGSIDRVIRVVVGVVLLAAAWFSLGLGTGELLGIIAAIVGAVLLITGLVGVCPAYCVLGLRTCPVDTKNP